MKVECYSEDFICTSSPLIPVDKKKALVYNRLSGRLAVIDMNKNILLDVSDDILNAHKENLGNIIDLV